MSSNRRNQRRQEQRRQRQTRRREIRTQTIEEAGPVEFSGPMGFMQRHIKSHKKALTLIKLITKISF